PSLSNSFRFAYNRTAQYLDSLPSVTLPPNLSFVSGQPVGSITIGGGFGGFLTSAGSNTNAPRRWPYNLFQWGDDVSYVRGRHALKFGGNNEPNQDQNGGKSVGRRGVLFPALLALVGDQPNFFQVLL